MGRRRRTTTSLWSHSTKREAKRESRWGISQKPLKNFLVQALHEWIEQLCDPEENFCESLRVQLGRGWDAEVEQDARVSCGDKDKYSEKGNTS